ncbi:efflux RND transporter periplasmic adaptor subunit [Desulfoplanes sp.]
MIAQTPSKAVYLMALVLFVCWTWPFPGHCGDVVTDPMAIRVLVVPENETVLSSEMPGKISSIRVDMGDTFKKGQRLVDFDCELRRARLKKAQAELESAQKVLQVNQRLGRLNSVSELDLALSESKVKMAASEVAVRRALVRQCTITAPFSGQVARREAKPHEFVTEGKPVVHIVDTAHLRLQMFVPSQWSVWIRSKPSLTVTIDETGTTYPATIVSVGAGVDSTSQTLEVWARIDNSDAKLLPGMSGTATFAEYPSQ